MDAFKADLDPREQVARLTRNLIRVREECDEKKQHMRDTMRTTLARTDIRVRTACNRVALQKAYEDMHNDMKALLASL